MILPRMGNVLIEPIERKEKQQQFDIIDSSFVTSVGKIIAVPKERYRYTDGSPSFFSVGEIVIYNDEDAVRTALKDKQYVLVPELEILATIEEDGKTNQEG